jgi:hypothetical protein
VRLFFADSNADFIRGVAQVTPNILVSFHYIRKSSQVRKVVRESIWPRTSAPGGAFFLDSGAHSANTLGAKIDLGEYSAFIEENQPNLKFYCGLDDINDYRITRRNQRMMEARGLRPLITYHYGEPIEVLEEYLQEYEMICIGGVVGKSFPVKLEWLTGLYARVIHKYRDRRIHMFGVHDPRILSRFPFYSADASSHAQMARTGKTPYGHYQNLVRTVEAVPIYIAHRDMSTTLTEKAVFRAQTLVAHRLKQEKYLTDLWTRRGIVWKD